MSHQRVRIALFAVLTVLLISTNSALFAQTAKNAQAPLVFGSDGYLYGTTTLGGNILQPPYYSAYSNYGTLFKILPTGLGYNLLHSFQINSDGNAPMAGLTFDAADGRFYSMTQGPYLTGGSNRPSTFYTLGSAAPNAFTVAQMGFYGVTTKLVEVNGVFYGTATSNVFSISKTGTILWMASALSAGNTPTLSGVTYGVDANGQSWLYGAASSGGANATGFIFKIHLDGSGFTVMKDFDALVPGTTPARNGSGSVPVAPPVLVNGMLYGTAAGGGSYYSTCGGTTTLTGGNGTLYSIHPITNAFTLLHTFTGTVVGGGPCTGTDDGAAPESPLVATTDCLGHLTLYGTTALGGWYGSYRIGGAPADYQAANYGVIYKVVIDPVTHLASYVGEVRAFAGPSKPYGASAPYSYTPQEGSSPMATLTQDPVQPNVFYATTWKGGAHDNGTVFSWDQCNANVRGAASAFRWVFSF
jgi:hypothetical protein